MKFAFVDYRISDTEIKTLNTLNIKVIKVPKCHNLYNAINGHTDIQIFQTNILKNKFIINKDISIDFINELILSGANYYLSDSEISDKYPDDIILNAVSTDYMLLHNLKYTDKRILENSKGKVLIDTKQGYTRCSCAIVSENAFITSDKNIYKQLKERNFDVLLIPPGDIILEDFDYGFIGGTCGLINKKEMAFFGNLDKYKYGNDIKEFLRKHDVTPVYLNDTKLIDRGGLLVFDNRDND